MRVADERMQVRMSRRVMEQPDWLDRMEKLASKGKYRADIAAALGISPTSLYYYIEVSAKVRDALAAGYAKYKGNRVLQLKHMDLGECDAEELIGKRKVRQFLKGIEKGKEFDAAATEIGVDVEIMRKCVSDNLELHKKYWKAFKKWENAVLREREGRALRKGEEKRESVSMDEADNAFYQRMKEKQTKLKAYLIRGRRIPAELVPSDMEEHEIDMTAWALDVRNYG